MYTCSILIISLPSVVVVAAAESADGWGNNVNTMYIPIIMTNVL